jgi:hypothetical protein
MQRPSWKINIKVWSVCVTNFIATYEKIEQVRSALAQSKNASHIVTTSTPKQEKQTRIPQPPQTNVQTNPSPTTDANNMRYAF